MTPSPSYLKLALAVTAAGVWINTHEFLRNELVLKKTWVAHYEAHGLVFPAAPVNVTIWVVWCFVFAGVIAAMVRRMGVRPAIATVWVGAFVLMWLSSWNLGVLPLGVLPTAVPWSIVEVAGAAWIVAAITKTKAK